MAVEAEEGAEGSEEAPGTCDARLLTGSCADNSWADLLERSCRYCRRSGCLRRHSLISSAARSWGHGLHLAELHRYRLRGTCRSGFLAAAMVLLQLEGPGFAEELEHARLAKVLLSSFGTHAANGSRFVAGSEDDGHGTSLAPFPFDARLWPQLQRLTPALTSVSCWGEGGASEGARVDSPLSRVLARVTPPAWLAHSSRGGAVLLPLQPRVEAAEWCPLRVSQKHLAGKCQSRLQTSVVSHAGAKVLELAASRPPALPAWKCPANGTGFGSKYAVVERSCGAGYGMWGKPLEHHLRCIAVMVGEALQIKPGNTVLDWGSGCGWTLSWLHLLYGAVGYGIDGTTSAFEWSSEHSAGRFCLWGSTDLAWVPDGSFHHVVAYWALYHLRPASRLCGVAAQLVAKLRPGGRAWFGGNNPSLAAGIGFQPFSQRDWAKCLGSLARRKGLSLEVEFVTDRELFRSDTFNEETPGDYLYLRPTYSVLVTRLPGPPLPP